MTPVQCAQQEGTLAFVEQLEGLSAEIETAMAAIAGDHLAAFEQSVSRQEFLCDRLQPGSASRGTLMPGYPPQDAGSATDGELAARLRIASANLRALNLQYAALLRHSGQSVQLMAALTNSYAQRYKQAGSRAKHQTWSCEG